MRPLRGDGVLDRAVAGQAIERRVERDVGLDERQHRGIRTQRKAGGERPLRGAALLRRRSPVRAIRSAASRAASASSALRTW